MQRRCNFADGDLRVIILEGQPIHVQKQWYRIVDAKTGLFEAGYVTVEDMLSRQPWPDRRFIRWASGRHSGRRSTCNATG
ncbi:Conserved membrane protein of uncharacterised function [Mycobacterium tuberculosis]|nr:Conserved membrane protein of uncharacterised function [Mycobacterium tuberculosis]